MSEEQEPSDRNPAPKRPRPDPPPFRPNPKLIGYIERRQKTPKRHKGEGPPKE